MKKVTLVAVLFFLTTITAHAKKHQFADYNHVGMLVSLTLTEIDNSHTYISPDGYAVTCSNDGDTTDCEEGTGHSLYLITAEIKLDDGSEVVVEHTVMPILWMGIDSLDPLAAIHDGKDGDVDQVHYRLAEKSASKNKAHYQFNWANKDGSTRKVVTATTTTTTFLVVPELVRQRYGKHREVIAWEQKYVINKIKVVK